MIKLLERDAAFQYYLRSLDADCGAGRGEDNPFGERVQAVPEEQDVIEQEAEKPFVLGDINGLWRKSCNPHRSENEEDWLRFPDFACA